MINDNAKKWVEALRSGKYKQGAGALTTIRKDGTAMEEDCCLGVGCKVAIENGLELKVSILEGAYHDYKQYGENDDSSTLPEEVLEWLGLSMANGSHLTDAGNGVKLEMTLVRLNDGRHCSFDEIATIIESEPEGMFKPVPQNGSPNEKQNPESADTVS